jgi:Fic/DOC family protein
LRDATLAIGVVVGEAITHNYGVSEQKSQTVRDFRGRVLPEPATLAGYAALIQRYDLKVPLPPSLAGIASRHHPSSTDAWRLLTPRHAPPDTLIGHLEFALKWEGIALAILSALFKQVKGSKIAEAVRARPTGAYTRRLWFLYEWLTDRRLDIADCGKVRAVPIVDPKNQFALKGGIFSKRHKVIDNLPGTRAFCPMVRRTAALEEYAHMMLDKRAVDVIGRTHQDVMARAAAFLLLSDSRSSFWIEGERPSAQRIQRWGQIIGQAGSVRLSVEEFERLQRIVIGDARFVRLGLRKEGGFVGTHDRITNEPIPDHVSARAADLRNLVEGVIAYSERAVGGEVDPVVVAAICAFGFVYVHPFTDGNGRLHRWLIHHVLAAAGYNPPGLVFPVSAAILRNIESYRRVLESYSRPLLEFIDWRATKDGNVEVLNDTADYFRYFDSTAHAEFLYQCVKQTVDTDLPEEVAYLEAYDRFSRSVQEIVDMPANKIDLLHRFLRQADGRLSKRARQEEFSAFTDEEAKQIEALFRSSFENDGNSASTSA